jgi:glycogen debranching enzyme
VPRVYYWEVLVNREHTIAEAEAVLVRNHRTGVSPWQQRAYDYTCPSHLAYPFQWGWDSAFHAIALLHIDPVRAQRELLTLLAAVRPNGFPPHVVVWRDEDRQRAVDEFGIVLAHPYFSATVQPPVVAHAIERVYAATGDDSWLGQVLPTAVRWFDWLAAHRDRDGDGLLVICQPDESGLDHTPKFDELLGVSRDRPEDILPSWRAATAEIVAAHGRPGEAGPVLEFERFVWKDVLFNTVYGDGLRSLARLCRAHPVSGVDPDAMDARAARVTAALIEVCWDADRGVFWDMYGPAGHRAELLTVTSLFPLVLADLPAEYAHRLVTEHLLNEAEFWLPYPVPSVAATEPSFEPDLASGAVFRGPSWVNLNWYLCCGLRRHGFTAEADDLARRTVEMVGRGGGLRECYHPVSAEGYAARDFAWSSLVLDLIPR